MTDEHTPMQPVIRDPKAPVNLLDDFEETGIVTPETGVSLSDLRMRARWGPNPRSWAHWGMSIR